MRVLRTAQVWRVRGTYSLIARLSPLTSDHASLLRRSSRCTVAGGGGVRDFFFINANLSRIQVSVIISDSSWQHPPFLPVSQTPLAQYTHYNTSLCIHIWHGQLETNVMPHTGKIITVLFLGVTFHMLCEPPHTKERATSTTTRRLVLRASRSYLH